MSSSQGVNGCPQINWYFLCLFTKELQLPLHCLANLPTSILYVCHLCELSPLLPSLASFGSLVLEGKCHRMCTLSSSLPLGCFGFAFGRTLRRLVAKVAGCLMVDEMAELLSPWQLGYGVFCCWSLCPCCQKFLQNLKLDFRNVSNSVWRLLRQNGVGSAWVVPLDISIGLLCSIQPFWGRLHHHVHWGCTAWWSLVTVPG